MIGKWDQLYYHALDMNKRVSDIYNNLYRKFDKFSNELGNLA